MGRRECVLGIEGWGLGFGIYFGCGWKGLGFPGVVSCVAVYFEGFCVPVDLCLLLLLLCCCTYTRLYHRGYCIHVILRTGNRTILRVLEFVRSLRNCDAAEDKRFWIRLHWVPLDAVAAVQYTWTWKSSQKRMREAWNGCCAARAISPRRRSY